MPYVPTVWVDNVAPFLEADNLNKIEHCLVEVTYREDIAISPMSSVTGSGDISKFSHTCTLNLEFVSPLSIGGDTDIFQFPDGFRPFGEMVTPVFNSITGESIGVAVYNKSRNILTFRSSNQEEYNCHIYCVYVTTDKPVVL